MCVCVCVCVCVSSFWVIMKDKGVSRRGDEGHGLMHLKCWTYSRYFIIVDNYSFEKVEGAWGGSMSHPHPSCILILAFVKDKFPIQTFLLRKGGVYWSWGRGTISDDGRMNALNLFKYISMYVTCYFITLCCLFRSWFNIGQRDRET